MYFKTDETTNFCIYNLGHDHAADHIFVGMPEGKQKL